MLTAIDRIKTCPGVEAVGVGLMSMLVIFGTFLLISAYAVYFIYKVMHAEPPKEGQ
jgi:hypothetical protein